MIDINRKLKNFGPLEVLVLGSITYVVATTYVIEPNTKTSNGPKFFNFLFISIIILQS